MILAHTDGEVVALNRRLAHLASGAPKRSPAIQIITSWVMLSLVGGSADTAQNSKAML